ncbi:MAG: hypothetical protein L6Q46_07570 [Flavobacterium sp.]|uniref:hypothetical protein n=1 Tax=Flavobacterium sp. TaxID=239 RepID=UPI0025C6A4BC|nr:hypothetical protein [Flavobacterium sp.]MCK6608147.1 hypothetical protein [Flavobacterium sp.]
MKKVLSIITIVLFLFSCTEKEKTYEELEAEVLCDVLPEVIPPFIAIHLPSPSPPSIDSSDKIEEKFSVDDSIMDYLKRKRDYVKRLAKEKNKIHIGLNSLMFPIKKSEFKTSNRNNIFIDSLMERKFQKK